MDSSTLSSTEKERQQVRRRLWTAMALCLTFILVEVAGGLLAGSLAILSDAAHLLADVAALGVAIMANTMASWPASSQHTFGLQRTESLAALFSMTSLVVLCLILAVEALRRLYGYVVVMMGPTTVEEEMAGVDGLLMSGIASIGVLVNVALALVLGEQGHVHMPGADHGHDHSHDHAHSDDGHSHDHSHAKETDPLVAAEESHQHSIDDAVVHGNEVPPPLTEETKRNVNLEAAYLHVLGDLAQSVAVLIAGLVIWWKPGWAIVDPLITLAFCVLVVASTGGVLRSSISVLLEEVPPHISWQDVFDNISSVKHVSGVHDLHIWNIAHGEPCLSVHATAADGHCADALANIFQVCSDKHGITHCTIQVQPYSLIRDKEGDWCITCGTTFQCSHG